MYIIPRTWTPADLIELDHVAAGLSEGRDPFGNGGGYSLAAIALWQFVAILRGEAKCPAPVAVPAPKRGTEINWPRVHRICGKLGRNQEAALRALVSHGDWHKDAGWVVKTCWAFTNRSGMQTIMNALVRRGAVVEKNGHYRIVPEHLL